MAVSQSVLSHHHQQENLSIGTPENTSLDLIEHKVSMQQVHVTCVTICTTPPLRMYSHMATGRNKYCNNVMHVWPFSTTMDGWLDNFFICSTKKKWSDQLYRSSEYLKQLTTHQATQLRTMDQEETQQLQMQRCHHSMYCNISRWQIIITTGPPSEKPINQDSCKNALASSPGSSQFSFNGRSWGQVYRKETPLVPGETYFHISYLAAPHRLCSHL